MLDYLLDDSVTYVTDGVAHAQRLVKKGMKVILLGGELKASTEAVIGTQAVQMLMNYHFTKGFFGTNGITKKTGFTTPDINEAAVKSMAMEQCKECYESEYFVHDFLFMSSCKKFCKTVLNS